MIFSIRKAAPLLAASALALGGAACGGDDEERSAEDVPAEAIALVGDQEVPKEEFTALMERAEQGYKAQKRDFPAVGSAEYNDLKNRAVQFLVTRYQYRAEAEALGIEVTDAEVTKRLDEIKEQSFQGDDEKFAKELEKLGLTEEDAREEIYDRIVQEKIYDEVTGDIKVSDDEVKKYYEENKDQFVKPFDVRHILVKSEAKAGDLATELEDGANFAKLAREESTDRGSAKQGGRITVQPGGVVQEFFDASVALEPGEVSEPTKTQFGWHLIQAIDEPEYTPFGEVEDQIREQLLTPKKNEAMETWVEETNRKYARETVYAVGYKPAETTTGTNGTTTTGATTQTTED
jgi:parvulin-like peptidyl-prolyl isomerase